MNAGVLARPETLQFAQWLANNATRNARIFQEYCFDYSKQSSNAIDSVATQILGMVKKTSTFLNMMMQYSTPAAMKKLDDEVDRFVLHAKDDMMHILKGKVVKKINATKKVGVESP